MISQEPYRLPWPEVAIVYLRTYREGTIEAGLACWLMLNASESPSSS